VTRQMNSDELMEMVSDQLRALASKGATKETRQTAIVINKLIISTIKHTGQQLAYHAYKKAGGRKIAALELRRS
jgi:hypothetical protein